MADDEPVTIGIQPIPPGNITFTIGSTEFLKLCPDGKIFVRGQEAATDLEVVEGMREFITSWRQHGIG